MPSPFTNSDPADECNGDFSPTEEQFPGCRQSRTNCAQGAIVVTGLIKIHEVSRFMRSPQKTISGQLAQFEELAPR
jgi:hypothetical protein